MDHPDKIIDTDVRLLADKLAIMELICLERLCRDTGRWEQLADAYTDTAIIRTTWFTGTAKEFAAASQVMAERGRHSKHPIWPVAVRIVDNRALVESRAQIQFRERWQGVLIDLTQNVRFVSRVVRTGCGWKLQSFEGIYEKGMIATVNPNDTIPLTWDDLHAASPRSSYQLWAWSLRRRGYPIPDDLLGDDQPTQLARFYAAEEAWLHKHSRSVS